MPFAMRAWSVSASSNRLGTASARFSSATRAVVPFAPSVRRHVSSCVDSRPRIKTSGVFLNSRLSSVGAPSHRSFSTSTVVTMESVLTPAFLSNIRDCWFGHVENEDSLMFPSEEHMKKWFFGGEEFDLACAKTSLDALEAIRTSDVTAAQEIIDAAKPQGPLDWLSLVILLDQMPRNCYRGDEASVVFKTFDPLAQGLVAAAASKGMPSVEPQIRWFIARRMWFNLPLMHSESPALHEQAMKAYANMAEEIEMLISEGEKARQSGDELRDRAARLMAGDPERARKLAAMQVGFEKKHKDIIDRFGRYPHRNAPLGRTSTTEEAEYLENGGDTFAPPPKKKEA